MNKSIPPFYVGQKVVALITHSQGAFKKGDVFTITGVHKPCCIWVVTVGILSPEPFVQGMTECVCKTIVTDSLTEWPFSACRFAPFISTFQAITFKKVLEEELVSMN